MIEIVTPAWSIPQSVPPRLVSVRAAARITGSVNADSRLIITIAPRNSFQDVMNANSATVTSAGMSDGRNTRNRIWNGPPPSMTAASSSSRGIASKLLRITYRENGSWIVTWTIASPSIVLTSLRLANIRNIGVSSAWYGTIRASSRKTNRISLPGIGNRASA